MGCVKGWMCLEW